MTCNYIVKFSSEETAEPRDVHVIARDPAAAMQQVRDVFGDDIGVVRVNLASNPKGVDLQHQPPNPEPEDPKLASIWARMYTGWMGDE